MPEKAGWTRFATETRAAATDEASRAKFRRYWRFAGPGILLIRKLLLPAVRREAERRAKARGIVILIRLHHSSRTPSGGYSST